MADPSSRPLPAGGRFLRALGLGAAASCEGRAPPGRLTEVMAGGCSPINPARGQLAPLRLAAGIEAGCEGGHPPSPSSVPGPSRIGEAGKYGVFVGGIIHSGKGGCEVSRYLTRGRGRFPLPEAAPWQAHKGARIASMSPGHGHGVNPVRSSAFLFFSFTVLFVRPRSSHYQQSFSFFPCSLPAHRNFMIHSNKAQRLFCCCFFFSFFSPFLFLSANDR